MIYGWIFDDRMHKIVFVLGSKRLPLAANFVGYVCLG